MGNLANTALQTLMPAVAAYRTVRGVVDDVEERNRRAQEAERERLAFEQGQDLERRSLAARQDADLARLEGEHALRRAELDAAASAAERARRTTLRGEVGRMRSLFGARGLTASDGSAAAVLRGIAQESEAERRHAVELDRLKRAALEREHDDRRQRNLLETSELAERQRIERIARGYS
jgi:colicin import membrane protein